MAIVLEMAGFGLTRSTGGAIAGILCFILVGVVAALCATKGRRRDHSNRVVTRNGFSDDAEGLSRSQLGFPRSESSFYGSSKKLLIMVKSKLFRLRKRTDQPLSYSLAAEDETSSQVQDAGQHTPSVAVWQRTILMGERCEPPSFSGLIVYDAFGNQVTVAPEKSGVVS